VDGIADGSSPGVGAEGVDVLALGKMDGLDESLGETGEGVGGARLDVAADDGGQEAAEGGTEIAGGEVLAGEEIGEVAGEFICGAGLGVFAGVVGAEVRMPGGAGSAALAAVGKSETTQGLAVLWAKRGHGCLLKLELNEIENGKVKIENGPEEDAGTTSENKKAPVKPGRNTN